MAKDFLKLILIEEKTFDWNKCIAPCSVRSKAETKKNSGLIVRLMDIITVMESKNF